ATLKSINSGHLGQEREPELVDRTTRPPRYSRFQDYETTVWRHFGSGHSPWRRYLVDPSSPAPPLAQVQRCRLVRPGIARSSAIVRKDRALRPSRYRHSNIAEPRAEPLYRSCSRLEAFVFFGHARSFTPHPRRVFSVSSFIGKNDSIRSSCTVISCGVPSV